MNVTSLPYLCHPISPRNFYTKLVWEQEDHVYTICV